MPDVTFGYAFYGGPFNLDSLTIDVLSEDAIGAELSGMTHDSAYVDENDVAHPETATIFFLRELNQAENIALNELVAAHDGQPPPVVSSTGLTVLENGVERELVVRNAGQVLVSNPASPMKVSWE